MAFNVLAQCGIVPTIKDEETVVVQVVQVTNRQGKAHNRIEARILVDNPATGYQGPTKTALVFNDVDDVKALEEALAEARKQFPAAAPAPPVVKKARQKRAVKV